MYEKRSPTLVSACAALLLLTAGCAQDRSEPASAVLETGPQSGGRLVYGLRAEPQTLNPVTAVHRPSITVVQMLGASLVDRDRESHELKPHLASSVEVAADGRTFKIQLPENVRFSDGEPLDADDVVFTLTVHADENVGSAQRAYLAPNGEPPLVRRVGDYEVELVLAVPSSAGLAVLDDLVILPEHRLAAAWNEGRLAEMWSLKTPASEVVGLGPFRMREHVPGERLVVEKNPHYWRQDADGNSLPYLDELVFLSVPDEEALILRLQSGEIHLADQLSGDNYAAIEQRPGPNALHDLGPGFELTFFFFNQNDGAQGDAARRQAWFRDSLFRRAVSSAIDREGMAQLVYNDRATPTIAHMPTTNKRWANTTIERPVRSLEKARELLTEAGFRWDDEGQLLDVEGGRVAWTLMTNASNSKRVAMTAMIQEDLRELGMHVDVVALEFRSMVARLTDTYDYDACLLGLFGDIDPNHFSNLWPSGGGNHFWRLRGEVVNDWQTEVDRLMAEQATALDHSTRKSLYDRVQQIVAEQQPLTLLVSPNVLVAARQDLGNFRPSVLEHQVLWNVDELYWPGGSAR